MTAKRQGSTSRKLVLLALIVAMGVFYVFQLRNRGNQPIPTAPTAEQAAASSPDSGTEVSSGEAVVVTAGAEDAAMAPPPVLVLGLPLPLSRFLVSVLAFLAVGSLMLGIWRLQRPLDGIEMRIQEYGLDQLLQLPGETAEEDGIGGGSSRLGRAGRGLLSGTKLAQDLTMAGLRYTVSEFTLLTLGVAVAGFLLGLWRFGLLGGTLLAGVGLLLPRLYVRRTLRRRQNAFTQQLPEVLDLLTGSLQAGHGLAQAMEVLSDEIPPPAGPEFARVLRGMSLGVSLPRALEDLSQRIGTDDVDLVVSTINIQYQLGGNLAQTLETIGETVRDRLRIQREIRVMTAQQRLTGYVLVAMPVILAFLITLVNPEFFAPFLQPGWPRILPFLAIAMQVMGFLIMRRILDIEV